MSGYNAKTLKTNVISTAKRNNTYKNKDIENLKLKTIKC